MKLVTAIFKPSRLDAVIDALSEAGATGLTVTEVRGYGRQQGKTEVYRGAEYEVRLLPKVRVEVACSDDAADRFADAIIAAANTGTIGDGKIFIHTVDSIIRIRTGERDEQAVTG
ncbi:P-II family nitrogen regulator [Hyphomonas johnsonii]|jgi:nitrogen regulatory protein P-II 2|uniref:Nitrogen regulatory protein P-II n=1 Tax=Hyphomonas johnsonii MHS-2 TaxID=1280950 RepID=A0A059FNR5_9PROT|nr:P-II family nitrogen regulator [Hyphomonas johnsonii]KCZ92262.1 nitrogen regulatory protein P-II [Hyphomonas johnsonii MHS-2]